MYTYDSRIRYSEVDKDAKLTLESLLDCFQDCSTFHTESLGLGIDYLKKENLIWVICSWQIIVDRYPKFYEKVEVGTIPYEFKGFMGNRNFFLKDEQGEIIAKANSIWSLLDASTYLPHKLTKEMQEGYECLPKMEMDYAPRKILVPEGGQYDETIQVKAYQLDTNQHVNNGQYVRIAAQYLEKGASVKQLRAEYKKQARLGDLLNPYVVKSDKKTIVSLLDENKQPYVNIEFLMN